MDKKLLKPVQGAVLSRYLKTSKKEVFRLETLPEFRVDGEENYLKYFKKHKKVKPWPVTSWEQLMIEANERGAKIWRIRRLSKPLTFYEKFECESYKYGVRHGLQIWAFYRDFDKMKELNSIPYALDYWMFDEKKVIFFQYDFLGKWIGFWEYLGNPKPYIALRDKLKKISKRLV